VHSFYRQPFEQQRRESAQRLIRYLRDYVGPFHPYLRRKYREAGIDLNSLREPQDIQRLPLIEKSDLASDPLMFILRPRTPGSPPLPEGFDTQPLPKAKLLKYVAQAIFNWPRDPLNDGREFTLKEKIRRRGLLEWQPIHHHVSTGSTGNPTPVTFTHADLYERIAYIGSTLLIPPHLPERETFRQYDERSMSVFPGAPHIAFYAPLLVKLLAGYPTFETFGGAVIPTERQIGIFANGAFNTLYAIPSYLVYWMRKARALQMDGKIPPLKHWRRAVLGAEPVSDALRAYLISLALELGADPGFRIFQTYGMTELKWTCPECIAGGRIHLNQRYFYWECLHPETRQPVAEGEPGVLVFSHIGWRGTVLIRYWTNDLVKGGVLWRACPGCGFTFPSMQGPICRAVQDFTKLKGTRVDLQLLSETVRATPGVRQYQIILESEIPDDPFSRDRLVVHVALEPSAEPTTIGDSLRNRIKAVTEVTPDAVIFEADEDVIETRLFARTGVKAEYIVERRASRASA